MILVSANSFVLLEWPSDVAESVVGRSVPMAACELGAYVLSSVEMGRVVNAPGSSVVADASVVDIASPPLPLMIEGSEAACELGGYVLSSVEMGRVVNAPGSPLVADASVVDIASPPLSLMVERSEGSARSSVEPLNSVDLEPKV